MEKAAFTSIAENRRALFSGKTTLLDIAKHYLAQVDASKHLNAYVEVFSAELLEKAALLDQKFRENPDQMGPLFGAVISIKDNICYAGHRVTAASNILHGFESLYTATALERLLAADALVIGRTNCDQFGMGSDNQNSIYGPVLNAADPERVSGGSSGGAAVSVQANTCTFALGSDTGGSVRQPAAFCGLWGYKPNYGRISRYGLIAYASSFDQIGVIAAHLADIALAMAIMAGRDLRDGTTTHVPAPDYSRSMGNNRPKRVVYFEEAMANPALDPEIRRATERYMDALRAKGHQVSAVSFDLLQYVIPAYYVLTTAEASSNLSRYDGLRYGQRPAGAESLNDLYTRARSAGFSAEVKRRILLGTFVLSSGYYDAYFGKAQKVRRLLFDRTQALLAEADLILMPVAPTVAWKLAEAPTDPVQAYLSDIYTVFANLAGIAALAVPIGLHPTHQLPIGVQLMASDEVAIFEMAGNSGAI